MANKAGDTRGLHERSDLTKLRLRRTLKLKKIRLVEEHLASEHKALASINAQLEELEELENERS